jgi:hypothetical protein
MSKDRSLIERLLAAGITETVTGAEVAKHRYVPKSGDGYLEFIAPRTGGRRGQALAFGGVRAERLDGVHLLLNAPWTCLLEADSDLRIHVVNPVAYLAQKLLSIGQRSRLSDRAKDWLYVFDTLSMFSASLDSLAEQAPRLLRPLFQRERSRLEATIRSIAPSDEEILEACRIARQNRSNPPRPDDLVPAVQLYLPVLLQGR